MIFLKKIFEKRAQKQAESQLAREILSAIKNENPQGVESLLPGVQDRPSFIMNHYQTLLTAAVKTDNLAVFDAVFKINPNPNYIFREGYQVLFVFYDSESPLLNHAIRTGAKNISLSLIQNPDLDISLTDHEESLKLPLSSDERSPTALEIAGATAGMEEVVIALAKKRLQRIAKQNVRCD